MLLLAEPDEDLDSPMSSAGFVVSDLEADGGPEGTEPMRVM